MFNFRLTAFILLSLRLVCFGSFSVETDLTLPFYDLRKNMTKLQQEFDKFLYLFDLQVTKSSRTDARTLLLETTVETLIQREYEKEDILSRSKRFKNKDIMSMQTSTDIDAPLQDIYTRLEILEKNNRLQLRAPKVQEQVAFATFTKAKNNQQEYISYEDIYVNIGEGLNKTEGTFTAPVSGIYLLSFSGWGYGNIGERMYIHKNRRVVSTFSGGSSRKELLGQTAILQLRKGDKIWVTIKGIRSGVQAITPYNHFIGLLLSPISA